MWKFLNILLSFSYSSVGSVITVHQTPTTAVPRETSKRAGSQNAIWKGHCVAQRVKNPQSHMLREFAATEEGEPVPLASTRPGSRRQQYRGARRDRPWPGWKPGGVPPETCHPKPALQVSPENLSCEISCKVSPGWDVLGEKIWKH